MNDARPRRFAILAVPRTGSNWLAHLLQSHPDVLMHPEPFRLGRLDAALPEAERDAAILQRERDPVGFLERLFACPTDRSHIGLKFLLHQPLTALDRLLADPQAGLVVLRRRNKLAEYASWKIAQRTAVWSTPQREQQAGSGAPPENALCDFVPAQYERYRRARESQYDYVHSRLARHARSAFFLEYERIGEAEVRGRMLDFLGLRTDVVLEAPDRRLDARAVLARFSNPDAVRAYVSRERGQRGLARAEGAAP